MSMPGYWEFPGGKVEKTESPQSALVREISEELNCEITVGAHFDTTVHAYDFGTVTLSTYLCNVVSGGPQPNQHVGLRWLTKSELFDVEWSPADVPAVERLRTSGYLVD